MSFKSCKLNIRENTLKTLSCIMDICLIALEKAV